LVALAACAALGVRGQVIGLQPTPIALYQWNPTSGQWVQITNPSTSEPAQSTPQAFAFYGFNTSLGQWTPCVTLSACLGSSFGAVTEILPGTNTSCTPFVAGGCIGNVTIAANTLPIPNNSVFVFAGDSANDDDGNAIEPTFALATFSCSAGTCTVTNTGSNGMVAGDWVNMRFSSAWTTAFSAPAHTTLATGYTLFQVLSSGLTTTQFKFSFSGTGSCSSTCGNAAIASYNFPFNTTNQGRLHGIGTTKVVIPSPVTLQELNTDYTSLLHPLSEAVTGLPTYFILGQEENDVAASSAGCNSAATIEAALQSLWAKIHTDGSSVIEWSTNAFIINQAGIGICTSGYQTYVALEQWLPLQGKSVATAANGQYWDIFADIGRVVNDATNSSMVAGNGGFGAGGVNLASNTMSSSILSGSSLPYDKRPQYFGAGPGVSNAGDGFVHVPAADAIYYESWFNAAMDTQVFTIRTTSGYKGVQIDGGGDLNPFKVYSSDIHAIGSFNNSASGSIFAPQLRVLAANASATANLNIETGVAESTNNAALFGFHFVGSSSASNYAFMGIYGENGITVDGAGNVVIQGITSSTAPICPNGTGAALTTSGCVAGTSVNVNGAGVSSPNFNAAAPSPDSGYTPGTFKVTGSNVILEVQDYTATSPIRITGHVIDCPTCGTGLGGTSVSQNSGAAETNLPVTGFMPQLCADSSGSGTAQSCTVANTFVPQTGNCVVYSTTTANSGTGLTVNVNSLGAKSVAVAGSSGWTTTLVASSSIPANKPMHICYDGTNWNASGTGYLPSGGGGAACMTPISTTLGSPATSITISSIPATCTDLQISFSGVLASGSGTNVQLQFNGDTGNNYSYQGGKSLAGAQFNLQSFGVAFIDLIDNFPASGCSSGCATIGGASAIVLNYAGTTLPKAVTGEGWGSQNNASNLMAMHFGGEWDSTAAINAIKIQNGQGVNFVVGTTVTVTGR
jgi:hypothetical protein